MSDNDYVRQVCRYEVGMRGGLKTSVADHAEDAVCTITISEKGWENIKTARDLIVKLGALSTFDSRKPAADIIPDGVDIRWSDPDRVIYGYVKLDPYKMTVSGVTRYRSKFYFCTDYKTIEEHFNNLLTRYIS